MKTLATIVLMITALAVAAEAQTVQTVTFDNAAVGAVPAGCQPGRLSV